MDAFLAWAARGRTSNVQRSTFLRKATPKAFASGRRAGFLTPNAEKNRLNLWIRYPGDMVKLLVAAVIGCALGFGAGYGTAARALYPRLLSDLEWQMRTVNSEQYFATVLSLAVLSQLERGDTDKAKVQLAGQVATYVRSCKEYEASRSTGQKLLPMINATSERSPVLQQELAKEPAVQKSN
jgi:hypothetical protein